MTAPRGAPGARDHGDDRPRDDDPADDRPPDDGSAGRPRIAGCARAGAPAGPARDDLRRLGLPGPARGAGAGQARLPDPGGGPPARPRAVPAAAGEGQPDRGRPGQPALPGLGHPGRRTLGRADQPRRHPAGDRLPELRAAAGRRRRRDRPRRGAPGCPDDPRLGDRGGPGLAVALRPHQGGGRGAGLRRLPGRGGVPALADLRARRRFLQPLRQPRPGAPGPAARGRPVALPAGLRRATSPRRSPARSTAPWRAARSTSSAAPKWARWSISCATC